MAESNFWEFIREQTITSNEVITEMQKEQITPDLISIMTDEDLSKYVPLHGNRLKVRQFLQRTKQVNNHVTRRRKLLEVLKEKIEVKRKGRKRRQEQSSSDEDEMRKTKRQFGNRNAEKATRRIEIGWIHKTKTGSLQVRQKKGGGTRRVNIRKDATKRDILEEGKRLFFPDGVSTKGHISDFLCDVWDFRDRSVRDDRTVKEMYEETKMPLLRFYFATTCKDETDRDRDVESISMPIVDEESNTNRESDDDSLPDLYDATTPLPLENDRQSNDLLSTAIRLAGIEEADQIENVDNGTSPVNHALKLHRGQVLKELIAGFKDIDPFRDIVSVEMLLPNGMPEVAEDGVGVTRDVLCEFWESFYEECTVGNNSKVPCIRHDFGETVWQCVAKIIVFGWKASGYFPVQISAVFFQQCMYNNVKSEMKDAFFSYIPETDARTMKAALDDIQAVDNEELLDILEQHEVKIIPKQENLEKLVNEIAHKELIQASMYVIDCWCPYLKQMHLTEEKLDSLYSALLPTPKRVLNYLVFPVAMSSDEIAVSNHLKRFIRELDYVSLKKFLRFCTGSDLLICKKIEVAFVNVVGLARRPVAHTCSCLLELPKFYENFPRFRTEFMCVLNANIWIMDII